MIRILEGDVIEMLRTLPDKCIHMLVTSPPYLNQRDYGTGRWEGGDPGCDHIANKSKTKKMGNPEFNKNHPSRELTITPGFYKNTCPKCGAIQIDNQIGLEDTPAQYIQKMVEVFREIWRVLRDDGIVWLNEGDGYASTPVGTFNGGSKILKGRDLSGHEQSGGFNKLKASGLKPKDLLMIPARLAIALQADGWYLRSQIPWLKRNSMPESITDRPSSAVEYIFMLTKSGTPLFWVHRDGRGARTKPKPDYRYLDLLENKEYETKPEEFNAKDKLPCPRCGGSGELSQGWFAYVDTCPVCNGKGKVRRWTRINLWTGDDYFYDADAIRVPLNLDTLPRYSRGMKDDNKWAEGPPSCAKSLNRGERWNRNNGQKMGGTGYGGDGTGFNKHSGYYDSNGELLVNPDGRNRRNSDWFFESWQGLYVEDQQPLAMIVNPQPYPGMHFATFPAKLVEPCIKAGTSEKGCCPKCGAPWVRMVEKGNPVEIWKRASGADAEGGYNGHSWKHEKMIHGKTGHFHEKEKKQDLAGNPTYTGFNQRYKEKQQNASDVKRRVLAGMVEKKTVAWQPTCECGETETVPCVVLDPFMGSGRTLQVARDLMRDSIGIDLNHDYILLARKELRLNEQLPV